MTDRPKTSFLAGDGVAHVLMAQAALIFALNYVIGRWAAGEVAPYTLGFTRWTVGALVLLPFAWHLIWRDRVLLRRHWKLLCLLGFLMPLMGAGITYVALNYTTAINGGVLQTSLPVLILVLAWIVLGDKAVGRQILGVVLAVVGLLYMISRGDPAVLLGLDFNRGDAVLLLCNLCLAGYGVAARLVPREMHTLTLLTMICAVGAMFHVPFFVVELIQDGLPPPQHKGGRLAGIRRVVSLGRGDPRLEHRDRAARAVPRRVLHVSGAGLFRGDRRSLSRRDAERVPPDRRGADNRRRYRVVAQDENRRARISRDANGCRGGGACAYNSVDEAIGIEPRGDAPCRDTRTEF